eukprot:m.412983 g.412983  ORF g.412983 m.412983 type:complete len:573 (-) comp21260_c1_seq1:32-1750(-)
MGNSVLNSVSEVAKEEVKTRLPKPSRAKIAAAGCGACGLATCYAVCCSPDRESDLVTPLDYCCHSNFCPAVQPSGPFPRCFKCIYYTLTFIAAMILLGTVGTIFSQPGRTSTVGNKLVDFYTLPTAFLCLPRNAIRSAAISALFQNVSTELVFQDHYYTLESQRYRNYQEQCPEIPFAPAGSFTKELNVTRARYYTMPVNADVDGHLVEYVYEVDGNDTLRYHEAQQCKPVGFVTHTAISPPAFHVGARTYTATTGNGTALQNKFGRFVQRMEAATGGSCALFNFDDPLVDHRTHPQQLVIPMAFSAPVLFSRMVAQLGFFDPSVLDMPYRVTDFNIVRVGLQNQLTDVKIKHSVEIDIDGNVWGVGRVGRRETTVYDAVASSMRLHDFPLGDTFSDNKTAGREGYAGAFAITGDGRTTVPSGMTTIVISTKTFLATYIEVAPRSWGEDVALMGGAMSFTGILLWACYIDRPVEARPPKVFRFLYRTGPRHYGGGASVATTAASTALLWHRHKTTSAPAPASDATPAARASGEGRDTHPVSGAQPRPYNDDSTRSKIPVRTLSPELCTVTVV